MAEKESRIPLRAWLTPGKHDELIELWEKVPNGERQYVILRGLELYFGLPASQRGEPIRQMATEIASMRQAMESLPYEMIEQFAAMLKTITIATASQDEPEPVASEDDLARRRANRRKNMW